MFNCSICGSATRLVRDHDHETGMIRGIVCNSCNQWIVNAERPNHRHFDYLFRKIGRRKWRVLEFQPFSVFENMQVLEIRKGRGYEIWNIPCSFFHAYLDEPPLCALNLHYSKGIVN